MADKALFSTLSPSATAIQLADGGTVKASGVGTVPVSAMSSRREPISLDLCEALLMPGSINLLSVARLAAAGHAVSIGEAEAEIRFSGGAKVPLLKRDGLYWLRAQALAPVVETFPASAAFLAGKPSAQERHAMLGHLNERDMRLLNQLRSDEELPFCEPCVLGKSKRKSIAHHAAPRHTVPGQLTHTDLCGPMETPTLQGRRFAIIFVDDATRYMTVYLVEAKSEALRCWKEYVGDMRTAGVAMGGVLRLLCVASQCVCSPVCSPMQTLVAASAWHGAEFVF
ncbi:MAG: GAG-pre-integrase domain-containing protein, partial [Rubrivivax sp.]